ncbi:MAG: epoxyqueuosine reductase QueH [Candidatus Omnitrophica bacterium]|nr:epoxyqueuosine reductase QueH [Candidatus Omnitrophota bacterium]
MAKLLLHTCCAPCLIYPLERLKAKGFSVTGFFYNPNIHPFSEYKNRKQALESLNEDVVYPEYLPQEFFREINGKEVNPGRCFLCWQLRLKKTAKEARQKGFQGFSTTLLVSPYQDQEALKDIGNKAAKDEGVEFYYEDFRPGFRQAHNKAKEQGIYCQKYCGCIYSEIERFVKK